MKVSERRAEIDNVSGDMYAAFMDLVSYRNRLEEIGCKAEAKKLDTVCGKLENICLKLFDKAKG